MNKKLKEFIEDFKYDIISIYKSIRYFFRRLFYFIKNHHDYEYKFEFRSRASEYLKPRFKAYMMTRNGHPCGSKLWDNHELKEFFKDITDEEKKDYNSDKLHEAEEAAWKFVLDEIYFAFRYESEDDVNFIIEDNLNYDEEYTKATNEKYKDMLGEPDPENEDFVIMNPWIDAVNDPRYDKRKVKYEKTDANAIRAKRGFEFLGKYWMDLWD